MTKIGEKSAADFFLDQVIGGRSAIRLMNFACGWAKEIAGKTNFVFLGYELDTAALSKNWLKPLDNQISIIKGTAALFAFKEKCWTRVKRDDVASILRATQHALKTVADTSAGIQCIAMFGAVVLSPYLHTLSLMKNGFSVTAGLLEIICRVNDMLALAWSPVQTEDEQRDKYLQWLGDGTMIIVQIFSIQLNFFGGYYTAFKDVIPKDKQMPAVVFNFWGTCASIARLAYSGIEYVRSK